MKVNKGLKPPEAPIPKQELKKLIPTKDLVAELKFAEQVKILIQNFHQTIIDKQFNSQDVFKDFLENDFVKYLIKKSFREDCYKKFEAFSKEYKKQPEPLTRTKKFAMLEGAIMNSSVFKKFHTLFFKPLEHEHFLRSVKSGKDLLTNWRGHLMEMEQYFEEYLIIEYLKSKGAVIKNNHVWYSKQIKEQNNP